MKPGRKPRLGFGTGSGVRVLHGSWMTAALDFIIPAHNAAATIGDTLRSLVAQTARDWRALVVDDGSTDGTLATARAVAEELGEGRIFVIKQNNAGVAAARNRGFQWMGERPPCAGLVCFLDADDVVEPEFIKRMTRAIGAADVAACSYAYTGPSLDPVGWVVTLGAEDHLPDRLAEVNPFSMGGMVFRRGALEKVCITGPLFRGTSRHEDWELLLELSNSGASWAPTLIEPLFTYRLRPGSRTTDLLPLWMDGLTLIDRYHPERSVVAAARRRWTLRCLARSLAAGEAGLAREMVTWLAGIGPSDEDVLAGALRWAVRREVVARSMSETDAALMVLRVSEVLGSGLVAARVVGRVVDVPGYWSRVARAAAERLGPGETLVIYGMGRNGRELARCLNEYPIRVAYVDDSPLVEVALPRLGAAELGPGHIVVMTPDQREGPLQKLEGAPVAGVWLPEELARGSAREAAA